MIRQFLIFGIVLGGIFANTCDAQVFRRFRRAPIIPPVQRAPQPQVQVQPRAQFDSSVFRYRQPQTPVTRIPSPPQQQAQTQTGVVPFRSADGRTILVPNSQLAQGSSRAPQPPQFRAPVPQQPQQQIVRPQATQQARILNQLPPRAQILTPVPQQSQTGSVVTFRTNDGRIIRVPRNQVVQSQTVIPQQQQFRAPGPQQATVRQQVQVVTYYDPNTGRYFRRQFLSAPRVSGSGSTTTGQIAAQQQVAPSTGLLPINPQSSVAVAPAVPASPLASGSNSVELLPPNTNSGAVAAASFDAEQESSDGPLDLAGTATPIPSTATGSGQFSIFAVEGETDAEPSLDLDSVIEEPTLDLAPVAKDPQPTLEGAKPEPVEDTSPFADNPEPASEPGGLDLDFGSDSEIEDLDLELDLPALDGPE